MSKKLCEFDPGAVCVTEHLTGGDQRENCLVCIIAQQNALLKDSCRIILENAIMNSQRDAMVVIMSSPNAQQRFHDWVKKYRGDLENEINQRQEDPEEDKETIVVGPDGIMTRDEAIARLIAMGKGKQLGLT